MWVTQWMYCNMNSLNSGTLKWPLISVYDQNKVIQHFKCRSGLVYSVRVCVCAKYVVGAELCSFFPVVATFLDNLAL